MRFDDVARGIDTFSKSQTHGYRSFQSGYRMAKNGAPERIRTTNLLIRSQMLYPVELRAPERQLICGGRRKRQIGRRERNLTSDFEIKID